MRIIAGRFRGRPLKAPRGAATRPTTDRVREALFSILGDLTDAVVVDFYSGTGAIGLEALSRGARHAVLVENSRAGVQAIRANVEALGVTAEVTLLQSPVEASRRSLESLAPLDVVLADPPWPTAGRSAQDVFRVIRGLLAPDATVAIGHRASEPVEPDEAAGFRVVSRRRWGDSGISFFKEY